MVCCLPRKGGPVSHTPYQQVLLQVVPAWSLVSGPCHCLSEELVVLLGSNGGEQLADGGLVLEHGLVLCLGMCGP